MISIKKISFTLYPSYSRVLKHSIPHFPLSSGSIACWVAELNAALCLDTRARKRRKYKCKYIFHFLECGSNSQPVDFTVTLCAPAPRLASGVETNPLNAYLSRRAWSERLSFALDSNVGSFSHNILEYCSFLYRILLKVFWKYNNRERSPNVSKYLHRFFNK